MHDCRRAVAGMGSVHAGFWSGLHHGGDEEGGTLFTRLVEVLNSVNGPPRPIYLTGVMPCSWEAMHVHACEDTHI